MKLTCVTLEEKKQLDLFIRSILFTIACIVKVVESSKW